MGFTAKTDLSENVGVKESKLKRAEVWNVYGIWNMVVAGRKKVLSVLVVVYTMEGCN